LISCAFNRNGDDHSQIGVMRFEYFKFGVSV
jgi:hypothetical protein